MTGPVRKQPDLRAAFEKAAGPNPSALLTEKPKRKRHHKDSKPEVTSIEQATKEIDRLQKELNISRMHRKDAENKHETAQKVLVAEAIAHKRVATRLESDDKVFAKLRKALGAGKDAKAEDLPGRIADLVAKAGSLEQAYRISEAQGAELRNRNEALRLCQEVTQSELETLKASSSNKTEIDESRPVIVLESRGNGIEQEDAWSQEDEIVPTYYTQFVSVEPIDTVKAKYAAWVLGFAPYFKSRSNRLGLGVNQDWTIGDVLGAPPIDLAGSNGTSISIRATEKDWVIRFVHPDGRFEGTKWWNLARLSICDEGTKIEHALIRLTGARAQRPGIGDAVPNILKDLFKTAPVPWVWEDYSGVPKSLNSRNGQTFVDGVLLNPDRGLPVVVVSRTAHGDKYIVDPGELSKALLGIAVVFAVEEKCQFLLSDALQEARISNSLLGCFDGGVRMYLPSFSVGSDPYKHSLWTRSFLEGRNQKDRVRLIARKIAIHTVDLRVPTGFARLVEDHDLKRASELTSRTVSHGNIEAQVLALKAEVKALQDYVERLRKEAQQVPALRAALSDREQKISYQDGLIELANIETETIKSEKADFARQVHNYKAQLSQAEEALRAAPAGLNFDLGLLDGVLKEGKFPSLGAFVRLLGARYQDRLLLLPTAYSTADDCTYQPQEKATELLYLLATDYYDALVRGEGDHEAAKVFGKDGFAPDESDNLSRAGEKARTFIYDGKSVTMRMHLKITKGFERNTSNKVFRTHFLWDAQRKVIVVGHIGRHLPD